MIGGPVGWADRGRVEGVNEEKAQQDQLHAVRTGAPMVQKAGTIASMWAAPPWLSRPSATAGALEELFEPRHGTIPS
jgi:hypothetical protein